MNNIDFEKEGLKLDQNRVLTYSQLSCPLNCTYCFVKDINFNQKKKVPYLSERQYQLITELPEEISLIMLGCDTEFFQSKKNSLDILRKLIALHKDISVITKLELSNAFIKNLKEIDRELTKNGNLFSFSVSIPCMESAKEWEPKAPHPLKRIETLKLVHQAGIKTLVAIRPLLPNISVEELSRIIEPTKDYCCGYYSGPLYLKNPDHLLIDKSVLKIERLQPHWMPSGNIFYKVERDGQLNLLKSLLDKHGKCLFEGAAEGIYYLKSHAKY
ncbi:MAG: radical SAM protein [Candidatus Staskawiczbacteria bacterium]|nr:radical SAM protein [Candidatus Staskawiczbacteria bacterium]